MKKYDYVVVGAGLFGSVCAYRLKRMNKRVLVIDKRNHVGGNVYTEEIDGINVHKYGAHIFHTDDKTVWDFVNSFVEFNNYINSPIANYKGEIYNLPFNMNTFSKLWDDVITPDDALAKIEKERQEYDNKEIKNLEDQAISLVGKTIYEKLIKGYTEKQWGKSAKELPPSIIKRIPVRLTYDNNYFNDRYQGIPIGGYTKLIEKLLDGVDVELCSNYLEKKKHYDDLATKIIYTGAIDEYYDYCYGQLEYRSLRFDTKVIDKSNYQGNAVVNYTSQDVEYTRVIEHKHFEKNNNSNTTVITYEYPDSWSKGKEAFYAVNDERNNALANKYFELSKNEKNVIFGGRLAEYKYYDMDDVIKKALEIEL